MIICSIELENWRGTSFFSGVFQDGLNVIYGANEAGKSTVVEALRWALFQDVVGGGKIKSEIESIIPVFAPTERPTVKVLLEFANCKATITKRLATESSSRECFLVLQQENEPDQHFEQSLAQEKLWQLMSSDGASRQQDMRQHQTPDNQVLFSEQGKSTFYIKQDISAMVRSALSNGPAVNIDGGISLSPRLEAVRAKLQKLRSSQLGKRLQTQVVDSAVKQSFAANLRDQLVALNHDIEKQQLLLQNITNDRQRIVELAPELENTRKQLLQLTEKYQRLLQLREDQQKLDSELSYKSLACNQASTDREQLENRVREVARHQDVIIETEKYIQMNEPLLVAAKLKEKAMHSALEETEKQRDECQKQQSEELSAIEAWRNWLEVKEKQTSKNRAQQLYDHLRELEKTWKEAQSELPASEKNIQQVHLTNWRERFREIEAEEKQLSNNLRFDIKWEQPTSMHWRADEDEWKILQMEKEVPYKLHGKSTFNISLQGAGRIKISTHADKSIQTTQRNIDVKRQKLRVEMERFGYVDAVLPDEFEIIQQNVHDQDKTFEKISNAKRDWISVIATSNLTDQLSDYEDTKNVLSLAYAQIQELTEDWKIAKTDALQYEEYYPVQVTVPLAKELLQRALRNRQESEKAYNSAFKHHQQRSKEYQEEREQTRRIENELVRAKDKLELASKELCRLCDDALTDAERKSKLKEMTESWILADGAQKSAAAARQQLGEAVDKVETEHQHQGIQVLQEKISALENQLATCRARLRLQCEDDPQSELEEMIFQRDELIPQLEREEVRLRGLVLLQNVLEGQRLQFGDSIAQPLNQTLSPWLSTLRGKATLVEFDAAGKRLVGMQTQDGRGNYRLDFDAHSGGLQEQAALLIRLIYLQMTARHLPSGKLPMILDDPLTHTDSIRRDGLLKVLLQASDSLQILYVSCHNDHLSSLPGVHQVHVVSKETS